MPATDPADAASHPATASGTAQLRELVRRQQQVIALQREIVDHLTHEVRTPIAAIQNASYLIDTYGRENPEQLPKWQTMIKDSAETLRRLMADLVATQTLAASARRLERHPVNPWEVVRTMIAQRADAARVELEENPASHAPRLLDPEILTHAFAALLDNALKFSPTDRPVQVALDVVDEEVRISLFDRGCGVPADETPGLFAPFHRASNAERFPGSGLGLASARCAAELHAGSVTFETTENEGSTFVLTLHAPLAPA